MPKRLDVAVAAQKLARSRAQAADMIKRGGVRVGGEVQLKPSYIVEDGAEIEVSSPGFVGRGGEKLVHALDAFQIDVAGMVAADIGASTGGFTDCLLRRGAKLVYAVDVGTAQLAPELLADSRVINMPGTNARRLCAEMFSQPPNICVIDVSFISLRLIWPAVARVLAPEAHVVALIKPQFEVGRAALSRKGVVLNPADRARAVREVSEAAVSYGLTPSETIPSPLKGGSGNYEFLMHLRN